MTKLTPFIALAAIAAITLTGCSSAPKAESCDAGPACCQLKEAGATLDGGWINMFDGESFDGWKVNSENPQTFKIIDGTIVAHGPRAHLFYVGPNGNADFTDFEVKLDILTTPGSNSGFYIHTAYQEEGWPKQGYEVQVNNSHKDPKRSGSLYAVDNVGNPPTKDNEWYTMTIKVVGKHVVIKLNDDIVVDYTEPETFERDKGWEGRRFTHGTFAIQGHDPDSLVYYKNLMVRPL